MTEKDYLLLLKKQAKKRVVCGFNSNEDGKAIVTTGVPVQYKEGETSYVQKKSMSYEDYMFQETQATARKRCR